MEVDFLSDKVWKYLTVNLKQAFSLKRMKFTLYMVVVLWLAFATQMFTNRIFRENLKLTEAFVKANSEEMESSIEAVAECKSEILDEEDKKVYINQIANAIGLKLDKNITIEKDDKRTEYSFIKLAKQATSEIKVISMEQKKGASVKMKHYIIARLTIVKGVNSIDKYKNILEDTFNQIGVIDKQITMQYKGYYDGELSMKEKNEIITSLVDDLQGEIATKYDEGDLYTVYAYTGLLDEYIVSMGSKVNIQIAITYNKVTNKTTVYLATPIINQSF